MLKTLSLLIIGNCVGILLRGRNGKWVSAAVMATVCFLLFIMGVRVGLNEEIMGAIKSTGVISAILFVFGTGLSVILTWLFTKYVIDGRRANATAVSKGANAAVTEGANAAVSKGANAAVTEGANAASVTERVNASVTEKPAAGGAFKDSAIILGCFVLGLALALWRILPDSFYNLDFEKYANWVLYAMLFFVGISIGMGDSLMSLVKKLPKSILWLPLVALAGTWIGAALAYLIINALGYDLSLLQSATINSAMGYYSLSAILTTKTWGATIGSICLLTNLMRELFTILAARPLGKLFGRFASTASGGATVTDTTLPIILKAEGNGIMPAVLYFGIVINIVVPFLLTFLTM